MLQSCHTQTWHFQSIQVYQTSRQIYHKEVHRNIYLFHIPYHKHSHCIDINDNLAKFSVYHAPLRAIIFDYYANFVPYYANLFSPLFVFIAVIFFTSKLAGNSEIIAMLACGMSFKRLLRPYMISAAMISVLNFYLGSYIIPKGTVIRHNFESQYKNSKNKRQPQTYNFKWVKGLLHI